MSTGAHPGRTVGAWVALVAGGILLASLVAIASSALAVRNLDAARRLAFDDAGPAQVAALQLTDAYVNQETGVRGFVLSDGDPSFLRPDADGRRDAAAARRVLDRRITRGRLVRARDDYLALLAAAARWRVTYADPTIAAVRRRGNGAVARRDLARGRVLSDGVRLSGRRLRATLADGRRAAREDVYAAARRLRWSLGVAAALIIGSALAAFLILRRVVIRPLDELRAGARAVADGDFARRQDLDGPREIVEVGDAVEAMRARILEELQALERSNAELEQFAYVASHDLQEPLRKIVSFNQMLQKRYEGQLDERADQYIGFAVDGARRMQVLINDLLAFSRVGRIGAEWEQFPAADVVADAQDNLSVAIGESGARVEVAELPALRGDRALLTVLFQNLIGNAVKFHGDAAPVVRIGARPPADGLAEFCVADNGIGIEPTYAERIFVIFQRLHPRSAYEGTGIGLAMCRKIVEYHGGEIWLDEQTTQGTTFRFTLPTSEDTPT